MTSDAQKCFQLPKIFFANYFERETIELSSGRNWPESDLYLLNVSNALWAFLPDKLIFSYTSLTILND